LIAWTMKTAYQTYRIGRSLTARLHNAATHRCFTASTRGLIRTIDMTDAQIKDLHIDRERLWKELHETCEFGKGERWGRYVDFGISF
jgi:hypothetical protein